ncbi:MAG TPA: hypothetical protein PKE31_17195 [Pseudomonadota bacterium]|nr:hypothetical protein [Pseudomonadota bacterium]
MSNGRRNNTSSDPNDAARDLLNNQLGESESSGSDDEESEARGQSGTKGTGSAGVDGE